ncbi:hypothetical protein FKM82_009723 [Ascaphus truei]
MLQELNRSEVHFFVMLNGIRNELWDNAEANGSIVPIPFSTRNIIIHLLHRNKSKTGCRITCKRYKKPITIPQSTNKNEIYKKQYGSMFMD